MRKISAFFCGMIMLIIVSCTQKHTLQVEMTNNQIEIASSGKTYRFSSEFTIIYSDTNPEIAVRPGDIKNVNKRLLIFSLPGLKLMARKWCQKNTNW